MVTEVGLCREGFATLSTLVTPLSTWIFWWTLRAETVASLLTLVTDTYLLSQLCSVMVGDGGLHRGCATCLISMGFLSWVSSL
jgi:hypothetical protein